MNRDLEDSLRSTLGHASEQAPHAPSNLSTHIVAHSRRRRARVQALVAAVAVVVVAGGVGVTVRGTGNHFATPAVNPTQVSDSVTVPPSPSGEPALGIPDPVEKVWPQAVWTIPAKLPGGRTFQPKLFIDDRTLLLERWERPGKADAIYAYDLDSGQVRKIADIRTPERVFSSSYTVHDGRIIWQTVDPVEGDMLTAFWSVPIEGGEPRAIDTDRPVKAGGDQLAVVGDRLAFSSSGGGIFTVPLEGGTVEPVAGTTRHHDILRWPWVGSPGESTPNMSPNYEEILNVETGETNRAVVRPGEDNLQCGLTTCIGTRPDGTSFYRLRDGSQERDLPGSAWMGLAADRFHTVPVSRPQGGQLLLDLVTGKSGDLGSPHPDTNGQSINVQPGLGDGRLVAYPLKDEYVIIDLTKIQ